MPFKSKTQEAWAFATHQPFAKNWAGMTDQSSLPSKISKYDGRKSSMKKLGLKKKAMEGMVKK